MSDSAQKDLWVIGHPSLQGWFLAGVCGQIDTPYWTPGVPQSASSVPGLVFTFAAARALNSRFPGMAQGVVLHIDAATAEILGQSR